MARLLLVALLLVASACSSTTALRRKTAVDYQQGRFYEAKKRLSRAIDRKMPNGRYLRSKDAVWLLLDRATTQFAMGQTRLAIDDYSLAIEAIDVYQQKLLAEQAGQILLEDSVAAYTGEPFEQILARVYFALALLHEGDLGNAYALLRQAEEVQQQRQNPATNNALAKLLFAALLEHKGDRSNAKILREQAKQLEQLPQYLESSGSENATLMILCHTGNAPAKISTTAPASETTALMLESILATQDIPPAWSTLTGIPVPALVYRPGSRPASIRTTIDGRPYPLDPIYDISAAAQEQLQRKMPTIVGRGIARMLLRRGLVAGAHEKGPTFGELVDLAMFFANSHTEADTRSWTTLPSRIDLAQIALAPGKHHLRLAANPHEPQDYSLHLNPRDLCVINIFYVHHSTIVVHIPSRFLEKKERLS